MRSGGRRTSLQERSSRDHQSVNPGSSYRYFFRIRAVLPSGSGSLSSSKFPHPDVQSEAGRGTKFSITLPITLAIIQALVIRVTGRTYCIPLNSVLESLVRLDEANASGGRMRPSYTEKLSFGGGYGREISAKVLGRAGPKAAADMETALGRRQHRT